MKVLSEQINDLVAQAVGASADDLQGLAKIHGQLQTLASLPAAQSMAELLKSSNRLEKLAEQLVLREVQDAEASLWQLTRGIAELQLLLSGEGDLPKVSQGTDEAAPTPMAAISQPMTHAQCEDQTLNPEDLPLVQDFVTEANAHISTAETSILRLEENPTDGEAVNCIFRAFHTVKGVAGFLNLKQIGWLAHSSENLLDLARKGKVQLKGGTLDIVLSAIDAMKALVSRVAHAAQTQSPVVADPSIALLIERVEACAKGELFTASSVVIPSAKEAAPSAALDKPSMPTAETTVKIATDRLDNLINTVGELVIAQAMVAQDSNALLSGEPRIARNLAHMGKITRELQELSMSMRMVPIQGVFQKMARLVRDLAKKTGKEIELALVGGETELDRNLVEGITDPLVHMVRNSADHGVEMPEQREKSGKPRAGRVQLKAYHHSGNIVIEISDDGRGLNKEKLLKKAIAAGIVAEGAALSEAEIFKLIFHAGLSTAEKVTDVSGRGVGMDVVKKNVESLRGKIDIASVEGKGATFTIRLPLTLAVIDGLVVKVGATRFILPILSVEQSLRPRAEHLSTIQGRGEMCMVRQSLLPLYRVHRLLDVRPATEDPTATLVVIVQDDTRRCCLLVDELLGQQQVVIKSLGDGVGKIPGVSGGAILGDGNVSLILDVAGLIDLASRS